MSSYYYQGRNPRAGGTAAPAMSSSSSSSASSHQAEWRGWTAQGNPAAALRYTATPVSQAHGSQYSTTGPNNVVMPREEYLSIMHRINALEQWKRRQEDDDDEEDDDD
ncbi:MAG: hypothetical protein M1822_007938 [Bathelium mastoideum]|nr:MAG: hypothetical protein M1822_007938 [Bathelium mastoideum]